MNIIEMKKAVNNINAMYRNIVKKAIFDCIREYISELQDDEKSYEDSTYYVKVLTNKQAMQATDEEFDASELQQDRIRATLKECGCELYKLLESIDGHCIVDVSTDVNNTISFEIDVDGMKFEMEYKNRYNM